AKHISPGCTIAAIGPAACSPDDVPVSVDETTGRRSNRARLSGARRCGCATSKTAAGCDSRRIVKKVSAARTQVRQAQSCDKHCELRSRCESGTAVEKPI